jgi:hypothetical protein
MKMQIAKRLLMGAGAVVLAAALLVLVAPKAAQAVVATLIRDIDNPARATSVDASCGIATQSFGYVSCFPTYTVPTGNRLVIQQAEASCFAPQGYSLVFTSFSVNANNGFSPTTHYLPLVNEGTYRYVVPTSNVFSANEAVTYYADPGSTLEFTTLINNSGTMGPTDCTFQLNGYLISYP